MPPVRLVFFRDKDGSVPILKWLGELSVDARMKCHARMVRLANLGHELRRPEADYLADGIYELRIKLGTVNFRLLYSFHGREAVILLHGLTKEKKVPPKAIQLASQRMRQFKGNPSIHSSEFPNE